MVDSGGELGAALQYGTHRPIILCEGDILCKIAEDVRLGRAFFFPRDAADCIPGLRVSPFWITVSPSNIRIIHDLRAGRQRQQEFLVRSPPSTAPHVL